MLSLEQRMKMLTPPTGKFDMVLDTDAYNEIDDQFAISYALRAKDRIRMCALYAAPFFNNNSTGPEDGMECSYSEILHLLALAGETVPVFKGARNYLTDEKAPQDSPAASDLAKRAMDYSPDFPLYVAAIGAITNIASALLLQPEIADRMVVVWLGGNALNWPDNKEFNISQDVAAARVVFDSGVPLVMLPCAGVVHAFAVTGPELQYWLGDKNPLCDYLINHTVEDVNRYAKGKVWSRVIWDVTTIGWLLDRENHMMLDQFVPTPIPQYDHHWSFDPRRPFCKYVYGVYRDALFADLVEKLTNA